MKLTTLAVVVGLLSACQQGTTGDRTVVNTQERKDQVVANLTARHPSLGRMKPELGDFEKVSGDVDSVVMTFATPRGPQTQTLLITTDNTKLFIAVDGPIDASKSAKELTAAAEKEKAERKAALDKAVEGLPMLGNADAKVTLVEFSDFQCPYCKRGADLVKQVVAAHGDKVRVAFMHFPLSFHPWARPASIAAICAGNQKPEAFWAMHDSFFDNQKTLKPDTVIAESKTFATAAGVDMAKWEACTNEGSPEYLAAAKIVDAHMALGQEHGVSGTPSIFVNGEQMQGLAFAEIEKRILEATGGKPAAPAAPAAPTPPAVPMAPAKAPVDPHAGHNH